MQGTMRGAFDPVPGGIRGSLAGPFADIDPNEKCYQIRVAQRIAEVEDLGQVDRLVQDIPSQFFQTILTLALQGIALRIAQIEAKGDTDYPREIARQRRREELAKLPADLQPRVEAWVKSYYATKPWREKAVKKANVGRRT